MLQCADTPRSKVQLSPCADSNSPSDISRPAACLLCNYTSYAQSKNLALPTQKLVTDFYELHVEAGSIFVLADEALDCQP